MVKVGIIGLGYWGPNLVRNFSKTKNCDMVLACDLDQDRLRRIKEIYPSIEITDDPQKITDQVDAVVIATPLKTHFSLAKEFLNKGKHVLIEKPICASSQETIELSNLAEKENKKLMVDHTFLYSDNINKIKSLLAENSLGKIYNIDMVRVNLGLFNKDYNVIWDLAPHDLSILLYLLNKEPVSVVAVGESFILKNIVDNAHLYLKFEDSTSASLYLSWLSPRKKRTITVVGSKKMLEYDDTALDSKISLFDKGVALEPQNLPEMPHYETFDQFRYVYRQGVEDKINVAEREPLAVMAEHFIESITKDTPPKTNALDALKVVKVIEAAQESLTTSKEVKVHD